MKIAAREPSFSLKKIFARPEVTVIIAVMLLTVVFSFSSASFATSYNLFNLARTSAIYMFIALGQAMVVIVGGMNLSLGYVGGLTVVVAGFSMEKLGMPPVIAVLFGLFVGIAAGFINGFIVTWLNINSFVVTLATSFIYSGVINGISKGFPYTKIPQSFTMMGRNGLLGIPLLLWFAVITLAIMGYIFKFTVTGRNLLATGGNEEAAKMSAVNTKQMIILANILSGVFAAIAGLLWISKTGSAQPSTGSDWMVVSFAVAVIGGTSLKGGVFNPIGVFFAGFLLSMVTNGLVMLNANIYFEQTYLGLIILFAVSLESVKTILNKRKMKRTLSEQSKSTTRA